jgi:hypothetical protein
MDRVEREIKAVGKVICFVDVFRGGVLITTESEMWFFRTSERWLAGLYRAPYQKDIRRLSRRIETHFRSNEIYAEVRKRLIDNFPWREQSTAQGKTWPGVSFSGN